jgi:3'-phosphoadenosine 5'-phosphosulfate (PAPS) 3'-phosphatase
MRRQRGIATELMLYGLVALAVAAIGAGLVYTYQNAIVRAERAEADRDTAQRANAELMSDNINLRATNEHNNKLLAARQVERNTAATIERVINAKLADIYSQSAPAREWRDTAVPPDILRGLRAESAGGKPQDGKGAPAGKPLPANAGR